MDVVDQWLQFDVGPPSLVTGLVTRGRGDSNRRQWVTRFLVSYSNDTAVWYYYKDASHLDIKVTRDTALVLSLCILPRIPPQCQMMKDASVSGLVDTSRLASIGRRLLN